MKNLIIVLLLSISLTANAQNKNQKCVTVKVEQIKDYRVKITKVNTCTNVITVSTMLKKEWDFRKKKRKARKRKS
jgi:hypothetical protein